MKKLKIIIPLLALFVFLIAAGAITWAGSAQTVASNTLDAQTQVVLDAISQKDMAKADNAFNQMAKQFSRHKDIAQALYNVACDYGKLNKDRALEIHRYNVTNYPYDTYAMRSQLEIFNTHYSSGDSQAADEDILRLVETFANQPELPREIYRIAGKYNYAGKRTKANELYTIAATYNPDDMYVQLSQLFCDVQNNDDAAANVQLVNILSLIGVLEEEMTVS